MLEVLISSIGSRASSNSATSRSSFISSLLGTAKVYVRPLRLGRSAMVNCLYLRMLYKPNFRGYITKNETPVRQGIRAGSGFSALYRDPYTDWKSQPACVLVPSDLAVITTLGITRVTDIAI